MLPHRHMPIIWACTYAQGHVNQQAHSVCAAIYGVEFVDGTRGAAFLSPDPVLTELKHLGWSCRNEWCGAGKPQHRRVPQMWPPHAHQIRSIRCRKECGFAVPRYRIKRCSTPGKICPCIPTSATRPEPCRWFVDHSTTVQNAAPYG